MKSTSFSVASLLSHAKEDVVHKFLPGWSPSRLPILARSKAMSSTEFSKHISRSREVGCAARVVCSESGNIRLDISDISRRKA